jgi:hypothetical protein
MINNRTLVKWAKMPIGRGAPIGLLDVSSKSMFIIMMLMPVQQNGFTHLRVLLVLTDRGDLANLTCVVDGQSDRH